MRMDAHLDTLLSRFCAENSDARKTMFHRSATFALGRIGPAAKEAVPALEAAARDGVGGAEAALKKIRGKQ